MPTWLPIATAIAGALVGAATFWLAAVKTRRDSLEQRVHRAVKGEVGDRFLDFIEAGEKVEAKLQELLTETQQESSRIIAEAKLGLQSLEDGRAVGESLEKLLSQATQLVPDLARVADAVPAEHVRELRDPSISTSRAVVLVDAIRDSPNANSRQLELAGDTAREVLEDKNRARELYRLACEADPTNTSARAEYLGIQLASPDEDERVRSRQALHSLAIAHPGDKTGKTNLLNDYVRLNKYDEMAREIRELLRALPRDALLWRNLGLALSHTHAEEDQVAEAYEQALVFSTAADTDAGDFVNTAKVYIVWLAHVGRFDRAHEVLDQALAKMPEEGSLYLASYRLAMGEGDSERARRSLKAFSALTPQFAWKAKQMMRGLEYKDFLGSGDESSVAESNETDSAEDLLARLALSAMTSRREVSE